MSKPDKKVTIGFSLRPSTIAILDEKRGREPRSSFVERLIQPDILVGEENESSGVTVVDTN
jgi:hypothetical protein